MPTVATPRGFQSEPGPQDSFEDQGVTVIIQEEGGDGSAVTLDPESGAAIIDTPDGGVVIDFNPKPPGQEESDEFGDNLAEKINDMERKRIAGVLVPAIEADDRSRETWLQNREKGLSMLGFALEEPRGDSGTSTSPVEGMSTVRHPLLTEAVIRFQSNAVAELLPAGGPVKVRNDGGETTDTDNLAEALERGLNHHLTAVDKGYRDDTARALFSVGFGGCAFKKVYRDPVKRMPISRTVDAADLIVSNNVANLEDAQRVTHRILMRPSMVKRMQLAGAYRDVDLSQPNYQPNSLEQREAEIQGVDARPQRPEDMPYTIYEVYTELNIPGFEHKDADDKPTGLAVPYRVVIEKDSLEILEIRRNYREDDPFCLPKQVFVKYSFQPAFGFYDIGLLQILGQTTRALTGVWRLMLDNGMFANFPGFLYADVAGRQVTNEFRVPPGGGAKVQTGGLPIAEVIMPLPYQTQHMAALMGLSEKIETSGQRVGGTAELQVGEGRQEAPVGTTLALIEQATKTLAAVHIGLHASQAEEFQLLKALFREDPEAFCRHSLGSRKQWQVEEFTRALDDFDLVPAADPNTPSHMHRIMKAVAIKQLQAMNPAIYDAQAVDTRIMSMIGINDPQTLFAPPPDPNAQQAGPPAPPPDPAKIIELQQKQQQAAADAQQHQQDQALAMRDRQMEHDYRMAELQAEMRDHAAERESREKIAVLNAHTASEKHRYSAAMKTMQPQVPGASQPTQPGHPGWTGYPRVI